MMLAAIVALFIQTRSLQKRLAEAKQDKTPNLPVGFDHELQRRLSTLSRGPVVTHEIIPPAGLPNIKTESV